MLTAGLFSRYVRTLTHEHNFNYLSYTEIMKRLWVVFLWMISLTGWAQTGAAYTGIALRDSALYVANTPADDAYKDSTFTYFLFLPNNKVCWFLSALAPQQQDVNDITGLVYGVFNYNRNADTLKFYRTFYDPAYKQTIGDIFTLTLFEGGIDAALDERIVKTVPGNMLYYRFKLCSQKK